MKKYYLEVNGFYDCLDVRKVRWYHRVIGFGPLYLDSCEAKNEHYATLEFLKRGYHFGIFHDIEKRLAEELKDK